MRSRDGVRACELLMGTPANLEQLGLSVDATPADVVIAVDGPEEALDAAERELSQAAESREVGRGRAAVAGRGRGQRGADLGARRVRGARGASRAVPRHARLPVLRPRVRRGRDRAQAPRRGARAARDGARVRDGDARRRRARVRERRPARHRRDRGRGRHRRAGGERAARPRRAPACRRSSASAAATCRREVGGIMFRPGMELLAADDETETLLLVSKPPDADAVRALGDVDVRGKRVVAAFVGWDGGEAPFEVYPTLEAGAYAAAGVTPPRDRRRAGWTARRRPARAVLRRLARARGGDHPRARPPHPRPRRGGVHAGPSAPDGRPRAAAADAARARAGRRLRAARRRARPRLAPRPGRRAGRDARRAARARSIAHVCGTTPIRRTPSGRRRRCARPACTSRRRTPRRRGWPGASSDEGRDAHLLGQAARRRRPRARGR